MNRHVLLSFALILACEGTIGVGPTLDVGPDFDGGPNFDGGPDFDGGSPPPPRPFVALPPVSALSKVKFLLVGSAPTNEELTRYRADPNTLRAMIDEWMERSEFEGQLKSMAALLFQTNVDPISLDDYFGFRLNESSIGVFDQQGARIGQSVLESWPETVWDTVSNGRDFRETMNSNTYMLNVPLMLLIAYADASPRDDHGVPGESYVLARFPNLEVSYQEDADIPLEDSVDPDSENFMRFSYSRGTWGAAAATVCAERLGGTETNPERIVELIASVLLGQPKARCPTLLEHFSPEDFEFRPVTIVQTDNTDERTIFFDIEELRSTDTLRLGTPRYGFSGDVGFQGFWLTNDGNEHRVTANQALIVALGEDFNPESITSTADSAEVDEMHADSDCLGCHRGLDPMRDFFRQSYTAFGSERIDGADNEPVPGTAAFGVGLERSVEGQGVQLFADTLFSHPGFPMAWAQKLCRFANAFDCAPDDEGLENAVSVFVESGYDFKVLLREVLASDAVVFQAPSATWELVGSAGVGTSAQSDLCLRLNLALQRPGEASPDVCGRVGRAVSAMPDWIYPRGNPTPSFLSRPSLFFNASTARGCDGIARRSLHLTRLYRIPKEELILILVEAVMGVAPSDARHEPLQIILTEHYDDLRSEQELSAESAAQFTFRLACESPITTSRAL